MMEHRQTDIDAAEVLDRVDERFYGNLTRVDAGNVLRELLSRGGDTLQIELEFGTFTVSRKNAGMGEVRVETNDQSVIDVFNAAKMWPFGPNISAREISETRYENKPTIVIDVIDFWIHQSDQMFMVRNPTGKIQ